jgi:hypothetical protein
LDISVLSIAHWLDWGDVPTWGATIFAGAAAWAAYRTLKSQRDQIKEQREYIAAQEGVLALQRDDLLADAAERRVAQARQIKLHAELTVSRESIVAHTDLQRVRPLDTWRVTISNESPDPVREVNVIYGRADQSLEAYETTLGKHTTNGPSLLPISVIGPGRRFECRSSTIPATIVKSRRPTATFTDASGRRWRLEDAGTLTELPS